jgi:hypothetical protein
MFSMLPFFAASIISWSSATAPPVSNSERYLYSNTEGSGKGVKKKETGKSGYF